MSLPDPNAAAPATDQPAEVIATTDEIEKKRIELKSMLSACVASGKLQICKKGKKEKAVVLMSQIKNPHYELLVSFSEKPDKVEIFQ